MLKSKKIFAAVLSICISAASVITPVYAAAGDTFAVSGKTVKVGDYFQMGTYYGKPILWRCVDYDENGALILSDKIICLKAFDASGDNMNGSHGRGKPNTLFSSKVYYREFYGSCYWGDSNIRDWLNSEASAGSVVWSCGNPPDSEHCLNNANPYDQEAGFLTNFTSAERSAIKTVTQKLLLEGDEYSETFGPDYHIYNSYIADIMQNYDTAYSETATDRMFLIGIKQLYAVYTNLGGYYKAYPTAEAVNNSTLIDSDDLAPDKIWNYWLRDPNGKPEWDNSSSPRYVSFKPSVAGGVNFADSADIGTYGVRPAFYLNTASAKITSGSGSENDPYVINGSAFTYGDADGDGKVTANDATLVLQKTLTGGIVLPLQNKSDEWLKYVDVDKDTHITASDASYILQKALKENYKLPL